MNDNKNINNSNVNDNGYGEGTGNGNASDNRDGGHGHKGMMKHGMGMMLCCLAPIVLLAAIPLLGLRRGGSLSLLASLICPIGMMVMMFSMSKMNQKDGGSASCHGKGTQKLQDGNGTEDNVL